ncbi:37293_t:CDS:2 [Gigaspora margarita]|uniref:37293_t:CDS:1 n=1 Tax=Gigaspora margarita TaxID=4874 RepID=A0ABN7V1I2_GIGMA|nr:37293_t:CDS:2 [Gigaspora margarita]
MLGKVMKKANKYKGYSLNSLKDSQNCLSRIYKYSLIRVIPSLKRLIEEGHLLVSSNMFRRSYINGIEIENIESILQEMETVKKLEIEMIKNRTKNLDITSDLIDRLVRILNGRERNLAFYTDSSLMLREESSPDMAQMGFSWVLVDLAKNIAIDEYCGKTSL